MDIEKRPLGRDVKPAPNRPTAVDSEPVAAPTPTPPPRKKRSALTAVLATLLVLALVGLGGMWWLMSQQDEQLQSSQAEVDRQKDLIVDLQRQLADPEEAPEAITDGDEDIEQVLEAARSFHEAIATEGGASQAEFSAEKLSAEFAEVSVQAADGGSYNILFKKVGDTWVRVDDGQQYSEATLEQFGVPRELLTTEPSA